MLPAVHDRNRSPCRLNTGTPIHNASTLVVHARIGKGVQRDIDLVVGGQMFVARGQDALQLQALRGDAMGGKALPGLCAHRGIAQLFGLEQQPRFWHRLKDARPHRHYRIVHLGQVVEAAEGYLSR